MPPIYPLTFLDLCLLVCKTKWFKTNELKAEIGCWDCVLGPRISGCWIGRRTHNAFDLASIFPNAPCCPWYLNEHDSTDLLSVGLALWAAFQPRGWIYVDSSTLALPDATSLYFYCRMKQICRSQWLSLFVLCKQTKVENLIDPKIDRTWAWCVLARKFCTSRNYVFVIPCRVIWITKIYWALF